MLVGQIIQGMQSHDAQRLGIYAGVGLAALPLVKNILMP
jgi:hypothetical protein